MAGDLGTLDGGGRVGVLIRQLQARAAYDVIGEGDPEGSVVAPVGATFRRLDGGASTSFYVKESGTGNTGWVAK